MTEAIFDKPCWVIDFLPEQVPADGPGQYFAVEARFLRPDRLAGLRRRFADLLLKLNCYADFRVSTPEEDEVWQQPAPALLEALILDGRRDLCVWLPGEGSLITLNRGDLYMTVYQPSADTLRRLRQLASAEGLFIRPAAGQTPQAASGGKNMYCESCNLLLEGDRCPACGTPRVRPVTPEDPCFLTERDFVGSGMLEDVLRQHGIPFLKKQMLGAGLTMRIGLMAERSRFYVPYGRMQEAAALAEDLFAAAEETGEEET